MSIVFMACSSIRYNIPWAYNEVFLYFASPGGRESQFRLERMNSLIPLSFYISLIPLLSAFFKKLGSTEYRKQFCSGLLYEPGIWAWHIVRVWVAIEIWACFDQLFFWKFNDWLYFLGANRVHVASDPLMNSR